MVVATVAESPATDSPRYWILTPPVRLAFELIAATKPRSRTLAKSRTNSSWSSGARDSHTEPSTSAPAPRNSNTSLTRSRMACRGSSSPRSGSTDARIVLARPKKASSVAVGDDAQAGRALTSASVSARANTQAQGTRTGRRKSSAAPFSGCDFAISFKPHCQDSGHAVSIRRLGAVVSGHTRPTRPKSISHATPGVRLAAEITVRRVACPGASRQP